jgi:hypothetical protein
LQDRVLEKKDYKEQKSRNKGIRTGLVIKDFKHHLGKESKSKVKLPDKNLEKVYKANMLKKIKAV